MNIYINGIKYKTENNFKTVSDIFNHLNISFSHPCGGKKNCGKCKITIKNPQPPQKEELLFLTKKEIDSKIRLSCCTIPFDNMDITFDNKNFSHFVINNHVAHTKNSYIAIDIGTTNIEAELFNEKGESISYILEKNSQITAGADIISRIEYDIKYPGVLTNLTINQLDSIISKLKNISLEIKDIIITGNTVMLYILTGKNTSVFSNAPYKNIEMFGKYYKLPFKNYSNNVYIPKCMDAFVGADITCGIISSENIDSPSLFADLGTNGEIVLYKNGKYYNCSTAAGPCFEGAILSCGSPAVDGAVSKVWFDGRNVKYQTINKNSSVNSICASGVIDFLTVLLRTGQIFKDGKINENSIYTKENKIYLSDTGIYLSQKDIRNIQLAKSAIYTGIRCLLKESGTAINEIKNLYLFGNFSKFLNIKNALYIGLLPEIETEKIHLLGNGALKGAKKILLNKISKNDTDEENISKNSINIDLNSLNYFQENFINNIDF